MEQVGMSDRRVALVTGASTGIGRAICEAFGTLGWKIGLGSRKHDQRDEAAEGVRGAGGTAYSSVLDVTDPVSVDAWFDTCTSALGPVDIVVNNAGIAAPGHLDELSPDEHRRIIETDLYGPILVARRAIPAMRGRASDLVFVSSDVTSQPRPQLATYAAAKAGVEQLARTLALELEGTGIRSTIVRLGPTVTDFAADWDPTGFADLMTYWSRFGLTRRQGVLDPHDVADAIVRVVTLPHGVQVHEIDLHASDPF
jgi:NAD(P)-dependent dehydrogenase (short-subunit alcohol dehydrogenase family)